MCWCISAFARATLVNSDGASLFYSLAIWYLIMHRLTKHFVESQPPSTVKTTRLLQSNTFFLNGEIYFIFYNLIGKFRVTTDRCLLEFH